MGWGYYGNYVNISEFVGKVFTSITVNDSKDEIDFVTEAGEQYKMHHEQDCCESVSIEDIVGDLNDLLNNPILLAEEATSDVYPPDKVAPEYYESFTWTFYKLATIKGYVDLRWYGSSNGYYSESVQISKLEGDDNETD